MIDYRLLEALFHVAEAGGFEKAAHRLCITQSAVSQRIKSLEDQQGQILISRESPPMPTERGMKLIKHFRQILTLEEDLHADSGTGPLPVGVNADSLATWFLPAVEQVLRDKGIFLELMVDDQEETAEMLRKGLVSGCISSGKKALQGCRVHYLGTMAYYPVSTPAFASQWFPRGMTEEALKVAPAVFFNRKDRLHERYLRDLLRFPDPDYPRSYIPSSEKFVAFITMGLAYGLLPPIHIRKELEGNRLILLKDEKIDVPLYWHHWNLDAGRIKILTEVLLERSRLFLS